MNESKVKPEAPKVEKRKKPFRFRLFFKLTLFLCILISLIIIGYYGYNSWMTFTEQKFQSFSALVTSEVVNCAEFASLKYNYSEIVTLRKTALLGFAKSYAIVRFSATVRAGIPDMNAVLIDISRDRKSVSVVLPAADILSNDIVLQEIFDESQNIFVPITTGEVFAEIDAARNRKLMEIIDSGFLNDVRKRNEQLVSRILSVMGFEQIRVVSK